MQLGFRVEIRRNARTVQLIAVDENGKPNYDCKIVRSVDSTLGAALAKLVDNGILNNYSIYDADELLKIVREHISEYYAKLLLRSKGGYKGLIHLTHCAAD